MKTLLGLLLILLAGCASVPEQVSPPRVTLADIAIKEIGLLEQHYVLRLRVHNPNPFDLPLMGTSFQAELNGLPFGQGHGSSPVSIPALGTGLIEADTYCSVVEMLQQVQSWRSGPPTALRYWIRGKLHIQDGRHFSFESSSEVTLPVDLGGR